MKAKFMLAICAISALSLGGCLDYQDELDALDYRVTELEKMKDKVNKLNADLKTLQLIVDAIDGADYITKVTESRNGYIVTFAEYGDVLVRHGEDGEDGADGSDGKDAQAPNISIIKGADGEYYWTLNGEIILVDGQAVRASGHDGKDGKDGKDGEDGVDGRDGVDGQDGQNGQDGADCVSITPQVRFNETTEKWEISVDGGESWIDTGMGYKGKDGKDGEDGKDGKDAVSFISKLVIVTDQEGNEYAEFTLTNGTVFRLPIGNKGNKS